MIDINLLRENPQLVKERVKAKGVNIDIDTILDLDKKRRVFMKQIEDLKAEQNKLSKGNFKENIEKAKKIKAEIRNLEIQFEAIENDFNKLFLQIPNLPFEDVPIGKDEYDNVVIKEVGKKPKFVFKPKDYIELAEKLDLIDINRASKVSGSRFGYIKNKLARLEFALVNFVFDFLSDSKNIKEVIKKNKLKINQKSFSAIVPPVMVRTEAMKAMGYIERGEEEIYYLNKDNLYLVGTSEQSIGPMHMDEILNKEDLPLRYIGFSTCFRREAGSYGKDTKGILRVHQFDKLEMFIFSKPEDSKNEHKLLLALEEALMQKLKIPYRVLNICTGDLGDPAAAKYDIEAWLPGQSNGNGEYRETHSTSNCTDFQARRLNIRFKDADGKMKFVHTLNGTAFAVGRILIAIIENYQQKDGSIKVPEILKNYLNFNEIR